MYKDWPHFAATQHTSSCSECQTWMLCCRISKQKHANKNKLYLNEKVFSEIGKEHVWQDTWFIVATGRWRELENASADTSVQFSLTFVETVHDGSRNMKEERKIHKLALWFHAHIFSPPWALEADSRPPLVWFFCRFPAARKHLSG